MLSEKEKIKYNRQIIDPTIGEEGQKKLKSSRVFVAGMGGLGCPASIYLAVAGVGKITIIDEDVVELSNLNRQILHWEKDIGRPKVESAFEKLKEINPYVEIEMIKGEITEENAVSLLKGHDAIVDAMDNFQTRFILNRTALELKIPFFHG